MPTNTSILLLSLFGIIVGVFFPVNFYLSLSNTEVTLEEKLGKLYISFGCVVGLLLFVAMFLSSFCFSRSPKICGIIGSVLVLIFGLIGAVFGYTLYSMNEFEDGSEALHKVEMKSNCCGWKAFNPSACAAPNITQTTTTCYNTIGKAFDTAFQEIFFFYVFFTLFVFFLCVVICKANVDTTEPKEKTS
ncbi:hypothetical protein EIN_052950 [Entamoeba invadens IP1]|uniref:hypothetical protein n=1 Tax=Entamoeba invadens IP1 TaxID=370355 RepID=UPI0002C3D010|nr:hypothetical protein EIN_052950 [Entamoeba invadens IP1]ELP93070.1 hypothetical protein EIN_052950 [Entamoeba invadens IP1]|eukprot:XP_004259841.1 hypothetical protein EIN_052950 [Entamoeba invadens IP1]